VDGIGSKYTHGKDYNSEALEVGREGRGTLNVRNGGEVETRGDGVIGVTAGSVGAVTVNGVGSNWKIIGRVRVGLFGGGILNISDGGLVSVAETLTIDYDENGNGFINMSTGGMLALNGDADDSLLDFLGLIDGTDAIRFWDDSVSKWTNITDATYDEDYTLSCPTEGDLAGYTVLTVGVVPEPSTLAGLLGLCLAGVLTSLRRKRQS